MYIEIPDPHPGRCHNHRPVGHEFLRCVDYEDHPHICRFPEPRPTTTSSAMTYTYTLTQAEIKRWVAPEDDESRTA